MKKKPEFKRTDVETNTILFEIERIQKAIQSTELLFDNCIDDELIDACIFEHKALQSRYQFLLKQARDQSITVPIKFCSNAHDMPKKAKTAAI